MVQSNGNQIDIEEFTKIYLLRLANYLFIQAYTVLSKKDFKIELIHSHIAIVNGVQYAMPNLYFKEIFLGIIMSKSELFLPKYPA